jgi:hypothetical protein
MTGRNPDGTEDFLSPAASTFPYSPPRLTPSRHP